MSARAEAVRAAEGSVALETTCAPVEVRSRFITAVVLRIAGPADAALFRRLDELTGQAPAFFVNAPIVLDVELAEGLETRSDFLKLVHRLQTRRLQVIGVQNATAAQQREASGAGLVALPKGGERAVDPAETRAAPETKPAPEIRPSAGLMITEPVRSGQVVYAEHGDLTVVAPVSSGAELVAAGSIHVYGRLSGRALAGVGGDASARIFCQSLEAELIAIAGLYRTSDDHGPEIRGKRVQAYLERDRLKIDPLK